MPVLPKAESDPEYAKQQEDSLKYEKYEALAGDTIFTKSHYIVVESLTKQPKHPDYIPEKGDLAFGLKLRVYALDDPKAYSAEPMFFVRMGKGIRSLSASINRLKMKFRLSEASMEQVFKLKNDLKYTSFRVKKGEEFTYQGYKIRLAGPDMNIKLPSYAPEEGDIAVAAQMDITAPNGQTATAAPVYLIRNNQQFSLKEKCLHWVSISGLKKSIRKRVYLSSQRQKEAPK